ncbi:unnamed protein product [Paramecium sonneborni]|uniref:Transmembrane protein n=1 Tax=Paramecium sonneborni TaxID=65129 RepID=A0A8S1RQ79_9CILI|nr:unnamed protein product [Paramecium sonneborni]
MIVQIKALYKLWNGCLDRKKYNFYTGCTAFSKQQIYMVQRQLIVVNIRNYNLALKRHSGNYCSLFHLCKTIESQYNKSTSFIRKATERRILQTRLVSGDFFGMKLIILILLLQIVMLLQVKKIQLLQNDKLTVLFVQINFSEIVIKISPHAQSYTYDGEGACTLYITKIKIFAAGNPCLDIASSNFNSLTQQFHFLDIKNIIVLQCQRRETGFLIYNLNVLNIQTKYQDVIQFKK